MKKYYDILEVKESDTINLSTLRFSFGTSNTPEQIDYLLNQLKSILTLE